ncbi:MAG: type II secretion system protein GspG [Lysobacteraceae bacterium]
MNIHNKRTQRVMQKRQSGFSLMEIMIVIVLIGSIVAFAATRIIGQGDQAKQRLTKAQISTLITKIEAYSLDNGSPPQRLEDLISEPGDAPGWLGPYASKKEILDGWGRAFEYDPNGDSGRVVIKSMGSDGKAGGDGPAKDLSSAD